MLKITRTINYIEKLDENDYLFFGDRYSGNESRGPEADIKLVEEYIVYLNKQLLIAKEYLNLSQLSQL